MMRDGGSGGLRHHDAMRAKSLRHSRPDAEAYTSMSSTCLRGTSLHQPLLAALVRRIRPPSSHVIFRRLLFLGRHFHKLGEARMYDTLRFFTMLRRHGSSELLRERNCQSQLSGSSIIGSAPRVPRSPALPT